MFHNAKIVIIPVSAIVKLGYCTKYPIKCMKYKNSNYILHMKL